MTLDSVMEAVSAYRIGQMTFDEVRGVIEEYGTDRYDDGKDDGVAQENEYWRPRRD